MKNLVGIFSQCRSGVAKVVVEASNREHIGTGSAFLTQGGIVTNSHVVRNPGCAIVEIQFEGASSPIRIEPHKLIKIESSEKEKDFAFLEMDEPEFENRYRFEMDPEEDISVGQQVAFMGFPFGMSHLTSHLAYISSIHEQAGVSVIQIDGSVNGGNSGGPLLSVETGKVVGIVTRAHTGLIEVQFRELLQSFQTNQQHFARVKGAVSLAGIDPMDAFSVTHAIMERIARDLHRSANVGIGYAFSVKHFSEALQKNHPIQS